MTIPSAPAPQNLVLSDEQRALADSLFAAIDQRDGEAVILLAPLIDNLDSHRQAFTGDHPLAFAMRRALPLDVIAPLIIKSDPRLRDSRGYTPLMIACWGQAFASEEQPAQYFVDLIGLLLPRSDPLALNFRGNSALHCAIFARSPQGVALVLPASDLSQTDSSGLTPIEQAREDAADPLRDAIVDLILAEMRSRELAAIVSASACPQRPSTPALRL